MKYTIRGKNDVSLTQDNFIFQGGEGKVYGKGDTAYKIYDDLKLLIPEAKIRELNTIQHPSVIKPEDVILNPQGTYVGFTMVWVKSSVPLVKLFTNDFRSRNAVTDDTVLELIDAIQEAIAAVHQAKCLIVDSNEFNYLVDDKTFKIPYLIDVNSWQTPCFPATAIMPSIRDPHSKDFSELTDWYSFGIIACQLFVGIHPFKGNHPNYSRKKMGVDVMQNRMRDNISIFNAEVSVPPSTRDFSCIPKNYREWFIDIFEKAKRIPPPMTAGAVVMPTIGIKVIHSTHHFDIRHLKDFDSEIIHHRVVFGIDITKTREKIYIGKSEYPSDLNTDVIFTPKKEKPVLVGIKNNRLVLSNIPEIKFKIHSLNLECTEKMIIQNTLFIRNAGNLIELAVMDRTDGDVTVAVKSTWNIMPHASEIFDGVIYQNVLGKPYLMIPLPKQDGASSCVNLYIPELEGCRIIEAKHENRICMVAANKHDVYRRFIFKFDENYRSYECRVTDDISQPVINFVVLDNGVGIAIGDDNSVEVFFNQKGNDRMDVIHDPDIQFSMKLCKDGIVTKFFRGKGLYSIRRAVRFQ